MSAYKVFRFIMTCIIDSVKVTFVTQNNYYLGAYNNIIV